MEGVWRLESGKQAMLIVDPESSAPPAAGAFTITAVHPKRDESVKHFLAFNQTDDAWSVQDIVTALRFLQQSGYTEIKLVGKGRAAVWAVFAAGVAEVPVSLEANLGAFKGTDEDFLNGFFVPGIQRAGGLRTALAVAVK